MGQELRFDTHTCISYRDFNLVSDPDKSRLNKTSVVCELDRVRKHVPEDLLQARGIPKDKTAPVFDRDRQGDSFCFGAGPDDFDSCRERWADGQWHDVQFESSGDDSGHVEDIID